MGDVIANFAGAGQVLPGIFKTEEHGTRTPCTLDEDLVALSDLFRSAVLRNPKWVWYVDYWTKDPSQWMVYYLSSDPLIRWTNENVEERDPDDLKNSTWGPEDIASWFTHEAEDGTLDTYEHTVKFHSAGVAHRLHLAPFNVTLDGVDRWAEYVIFGVKGAMGTLVETFDHLDGIEVRRA